MKSRREFVAGLDHPVGGNRNDLAVVLAEDLLPVHGDGSRHEARWVDHVPRAAGVEHDFGVRQVAQHRAGAAGMVEVDVGEDQVADARRGNALRCKRRQHVRDRVVGADVDQRCRSPLAQEMDRGEQRALETRIDGADAVVEVPDRSETHG